jgi:hypothetical protein
LSVMPEWLLEILAHTYVELFFLIFFATKQGYYIEISVYFYHTKNASVTGDYVAYYHR